MVEISKKMVDELNFYKNLTKWEKVNTVISNTKTALMGTDSRFEISKYAWFYLAKPNVELTAYSI
jgi:hypothetical protein